MTDTIQDLLPSLPVQTETTPPKEPYFDEHIWPAELATILKQNPRSVKLVVEGPAALCWNCGGAGMMMVYTWTHGPFASPTGGKVKWLDCEGITRGWYLGETHAAPCPCCQGEAWREYVRANCGLKGPELDVSIEGFKARGPYSGKEPSLTVARSLLAMNERPSGFVTLHGEPGRGKSHLLKGLVNGFRGLGVYAQYGNAADIFQAIKDRFSDDHGGIVVEAAIRHYRHVRVLAIDELDQLLLNLTPWTKQTLHRLLDTRYEDPGLLTLIAMKDGPDGLPEELAYLASRMRGGTVVEVKGPDMRGLPKPKYNQPEVSYDPD